MTRFWSRFIGTLMLDAGAFEDVEADRYAGVQATVVVLIASSAAAFAAMSISSEGAPGFAYGMAATLGAWLLWAFLISAIGTHLLPTPETRSDPAELLRTIGFAAAPGIFYAFAGMRVVTPFVFAVVTAWMIAATVIAVRQALDYRSTGRAIGVCVVAWLLAAGMTAAISMLFVRTVS